MALTPLASAEDLEARGVDTTETARVVAMLAVASASVRGAAGSPISETTSTVTLTGTWDDTRVPLPGPPVQAVATVELDGSAVTDWKLDNGRLWRRCGWTSGCPGEPVSLEITYTHGMPEVPADVVDLVCSLAAAGLNAATEGYAARTGVIAERIDDYSVQYAQGAEAVATVMELPERTRRWLRARFGGNTGMVTTR